MTRKANKRPTTNKSLPNQHATMYKQYNIDHDTGMAAFGSCCNWVAFFFALFAACSPYWVWGFFNGEVSHGGYHPYGYASASASPWIAGMIYKSVPSYTCAWCSVSYSTYPVYWADVTGQAACQSNTTAYKEWAKPLGYCRKSTPDQLVFTAPTQPIHSQGVIIASCVFLAIAAVTGCMDACAEESDSNIMAKLTTMFSFLAMIMLICSFSLWVDFQWTSLVISNDGFYMPVWANPYENILSAIPVFFVLGPGWGCALFAFILNVFGTCLHSVSISPLVTPDDVPPIPTQVNSGLPGNTSGPIISV